MIKPNDLTPLNNFVENIDINKLKQYAPRPTSNISKAPEVLVSPNPIHETNKILVDQNKRIDDLSNKLEQANIEISNQTKELESIHYENMKLNAQINILNKTIDTQNDEVIKLRNINTELKFTNQTLKDNNKNATRNAILLSIGTGVALIAIEHWYDIYQFILHLTK